MILCGAVSWWHDELSVSLVNRARLGCAQTAYAVVKKEKGLKGGIMDESPPLHSFLPQVCCVARVSAALDVANTHHIYVLNRQRTSLTIGLALSKPSRDSIGFNLRRIAILAWRCFERQAEDYCYQIWQRYEMNKCPFCKKPSIAKVKLSASSKHFVKRRSSGSSSDPAWRAWSQLGNALNQRQRVFYDTCLNHF